MGGAGEARSEGAMRDDDERSGREAAGVVSKGERNSWIVIKIASQEVCFGEVDGWVELIRSLVDGSSVEEKWVDRFKPKT